MNFLAQVLSQLVETTEKNTFTYFRWKTSVVLSFRFQQKIAIE